MLHRLRSLVRFQYVAELFLIILFAWSATTGYQNFDPTWRLGGLETEYLTSSAEWVSQVFHKWGYIPQWQPYLDRGQPAVDEAYSFIINPFNAAPILAFGANNGIKLSIILHFIIAGTGGWLLGWTLGWRTLARLLMGCLLILKGDMQSVIGMGFFQLGIAQAYFPWVLAGALAVVLHPGKRWPPVLLALSLALLYFCGNLYYVLPAVILVALAAAAYLFSYSGNRLRVTVDITILKRFIFAGILTLGFVAVTALTIGINYSLVRGHSDQHIQQVGDPIFGLFQFVEPTRYFHGLFLENLYSYSAPIWFVGLVFIFLPPIGLLNRPATPEQGWRLWVLSLFSLVLFFTWGLGINPVINWLYNSVPLLAQWHFPERMMVVAAFLFIFLLALRVDGLYRAIILSIDYRRRRTGYVTKLLVTGALFLAGGLAVAEVYQNRDPFDYVWREDTSLYKCANFLSSAFPNDFISVRRRDYGIIMPFLRNQQRMDQIGAAYDLGGLDSTLYPYDLTRTLPEFYVPSWDEDPNWLRSLGYRPVPGSPTLAPDLDLACVWRKADALGYVFSVPLEQLQNAHDPLPFSITSPVTYLGRTPEIIALEAQPSPDEPIVVVAQDVDYPGWTVQVDGEAAEVVSVGQLLGVVLPPGNTPKRVEFIYTASMLKVGGIITVIAALGAILFLLQVDHLRYPSQWRVVNAGRRLLRLPQALMGQAPETAAVIPLPPGDEPTSERTPVASTVYVEGARTVIRVDVPPSGRPSQVEIAFPNFRRERNAGLIVLAGLGVVAVFLFARRQNTKR